MAKSFRVAAPTKQGSDGEKPIPQPSLQPTSPLPQPSSYDAERMHSPTIAWPEAGGPQDNKPFRIRK